MKKLNSTPYYITLVLAFFIICNVSGCDQRTDVKTIHLGHGLDVTHPVHQAMEFMADHVAQKSNGNLRIKVFPNQQLGSERELIELLQIGSLGMTKVSAAVLENFTPKARIFSLPYLFRDNRQRFAVLDGKIGRELLLAPQSSWLRGLTYYDAGKRSFYTKTTAIEKPEDLDNLKIRVMESQMAINMVNKLSGSPTPISWGELYSALQQGIVDGAENNPPSFFTSRHYEVCKYYSLDEHTAIPDVLLIGTKTWKKLTKQEQQWVQEAADSSSVYQRKLWSEAEDEALKKVKAAGVEINRPDKEPFIELTEPIYDRLKQNDPELYKMVQEIRDVQP